MKTLLRGLALGLVLPLCSPSMVRGTDGARTNPPGKNNGDVLLSTMQRELRRAQAKLGQLDPAPYFASYSVYDQQGTVMVGGLGSLLNFTQFHRRTGEVTMRVGSVALDNTHQENRNSGINSGLVPLEDDADAVARVLWQLTYEEYRRAAQSYLNVKTAAAVRTQEEDTSPDFAPAKPEVHLDYAMPVFHLDRKDWEDRVRRYSSNFRQYPEIYSSAVMVIGEQTQMRFVSTDGTQLATPGTIIRMMIEAETRADDGMELLRVETFQADDSRRSARRSGSGGQNCQDGFRPEGPAGGSHGRALRWAGIALGTGGRGFLSRSARPSSGGPPPAWRPGRSDVHQKDQSAGAAPVSQRD